MNEPKIIDSDVARARAEGPVGCQMCGAIGENFHYDGCPALAEEPAAPLTEAKVRAIVREEIDAAPERWLKENQR